MSPQRTLEYLAYLVAFILLWNLAEAAIIQPQGNLNGATVDSPHPAISSASASVHDQLARSESMRRSLTECDSGFSWMCLKVEFVKIIERLAEQEELNLTTGVSIVKDANATSMKTSEMIAEVARNFPNDPSARLDGYILAKLGNMLQTRSLRFKLLDDDSSTAAEETGRKGKFGKKGGLEALLAAGLMMKGTLMALALGAIALMAGKALMTSLMALTLSGVLGLKSLSGGKSTTYEIVAKPVYSSSHSHSVSHEDGHASHGGHYSSGHSGSGGYGGY